MDVSGEDGDEALSHLKVLNFDLMLQKYAIRKKVVVSDISSMIQVFSVQTDYGADCKEGIIFDELQSRAEMFESEEFPGQMETDVLAFADPRTSFMGIRVMCGEGSFEIDDPKIKYYQNDDSSEYDLMRYLNAIAEGS